MSTWQVVQVEKSKKRGVMFKILQVAVKSKSHFTYFDLVFGIGNTPLVILQSVVPANARAIWKL